MKNALFRIFLLSALLVLVLSLAACGGTPAASPSGSPSSEPEAQTDPVNPVRPERSPQLLPTGSGIAVVKAADWESAHPDIYASYMKNYDNDEHHQYPEAYPYISVLYEGMGFAFDYKSARGHPYSLIDLDASGRPHPFANCYACKTPDLHAMIAEQGEEVYAIPYADLLDQITEPISCFSCHANEPGELIVTHQYLSVGLGDDFAGAAPESLACAQCHVEYYFDPVSRAVTLPYSNLRSMNPDSILTYYNNTTMPDGLVYADYVNPRSGVRQIKVQHPEFETFNGSGSQHRNDFACADCHMGYVDNEVEERFVNHEWMSPLSHPNLVAETCSECHVDYESFETFVRNIQDEAKERTNAIGGSLAEFMEELVLAVDSGEYSDEQLDPVRMKFRDAQFYWDFVFVENSNGAHNSNLTHHALEKAELLFADAKELFDALLN